MEKEHPVSCVYVFLFLHVCVCVFSVINRSLSFWRTKQEISLDFVSFTIQAVLRKKSCLWVSTSTGSFPEPWGTEQRLVQWPGKPWREHKRTLIKGWHQTGSYRKAAEASLVSAQDHASLRLQSLQNSIQSPTRSQRRRIVECSSFAGLSKSSNLIHSQM
jgi:hypothetical protein